VSHRLTSLITASLRAGRLGGRLPSLAAAGVALVLVVGAFAAVAPSPAVASSTYAARCDGVALRSAPRTNARLMRSLSKGTRVVAVARVSGSHWSARCAGSTSSGSTWLRITTVSGKTAKSLWGVSYVYAAVGLFKGVTVSRALEAACSGVSLRTSPRTTATRKRTLSAGTRVTGYGTVSGGSFSTTCNGSKVAGSTWWRITAIGGKSVKSLYGVTYLYAANGLLRSAGTATPAPTATPTVPPAPSASPSATPAPTPTPPANTSYSEGIDVSHWQGTIDWAAVAGAGKRFAYIKASEDADFVDNMYATNRAQAKANGLVVGAYHFAQPSLASGDAAAEADHFVDTAVPASGELLPVLDLEVTNGLGVADLQAWVKAFLGRVYTRTGIRGAIYVSPSFWSGKMGNTTWFAKNGYPVLWVAHWTTGDAPTVPGSNWGGNGWTFWQYTSSGTVAGIGGRVDLDRYRSKDFTPVLIP
jgi:GH25 family lysozyme M1 (1,4-beta-N-acetylmuramidase)